jgi:hypothetical protein
MVNNLFLGPGILLQGTAANVDTTHNLSIVNVATALLGDPATFNFWPGSNSPCVNAGVAPGAIKGISLVPEFSYLHPMSHMPRWYAGSAPDVGAYEFLTSPYRFLEDEPSISSFSIVPNPLGRDQQLNVELAQMLSGDEEANVWNMAGQLVQTVALPQGTRKLSLSLPDLSAGTYLLQISGIGVRKFVIAH